MITGAARSSHTSDLGGIVYAGLYVCLVIPGLVIGTVGGGTKLSTQKECLSMMGCFGKVTFNCTMSPCIAICTYRHKYIYSLNVQNMNSLDMHSGYIYMCNISYALTVYCHMIH